MYTRIWIPRMFHWLATLVATLALAACGGNDVVPPPPPAMLGSATIGPAGGTVQGPDGVTLVVPSGALTEPVTIRIARSAVGAPTLPDWLPSDVAVYEVTPHELQFLRPVSLRFPHGGAGGDDPAVLVASVGGEWQWQGARRASREVEVERLSLSYYISSLWFPTGCVFGQDPYRCVPARITSGPITATPPAALVEQVSQPPTIVANAVLHYDLQMTAPADCANARLTVDRILLANGRLQPLQRVLDLALPMTRGVPSPEQSSTSARFDPTLTAADNGIVTYAFTFRCTRTLRSIPEVAIGFSNVRVNIAPPPGAPTITQQPASITVAAGQSATFSVRATAPNTLSVDWMRSNDGGSTWASIGPGTAVTGGSDFTLTAQLVDQDAQFRVDVCNVSGAQRTCLQSGVATLTVTPAPVAPTFVAQPADVGVIAGQTASFTVVASGTPAPKIDWLVAAPGTNNFSPVSAQETGCAGTAAPAAGTQTTSTCTIAQTPTSASGQRYRAVATNAAGVVNSSPATLTVQAAAQPPVITQQPQPQTAPQGGSASFSFTATGTAPMTPTWRLNGIDIVNMGGAFSVDVAGCTALASIASNTLTLANLGAGCNGVSITVFLFNGVGPGVSSNPAVLTLSGGRPTVLVSPTSQSVDVGQQATFTIDAVGVNLTYQWQRARVINLYPVTAEFFSDIPGATGPTYTTPPANLGDDRMRLAVRICNGAAQPPSYPNCVFPGLLGDVQLTINEVPSQDFAVVGSGLTTENLNGVAFATRSIGVVVGNNGTILRTTDGGQNWAAVPSGTTSNLLAVAFSDLGRGTAVGLNMLLITLDYGATWTAPYAVQGNTCCGDVAYADASVGIIAGVDVGSRGFLRSTDGGLSWPVEVNSLLAPYRVRFGSATNGAAIGRAGQVLYTVDAGQTWTTAKMPQGVFLEWLGFASSNIAVGANGFGRLARSTDGGQSWSDLYGGAATRAANAFAFNGAGIGLAVGDGSSFGIMRTPDFGQTWVPFSLPNLSGTMFGLAFADASVAVAVGSGGTIVRFGNTGL